MLSVSHWLIKLGIDKDEKNFKISVEVYIPVQQYSYQGEMNESGLKAEIVASPY